MICASPGCGKDENDSCHFQWGGDHDFVPPPAPLVESRVDEARVLDIAVKWWEVDDTTLTLIKGAVVDAIRSERAACVEWVRSAEGDGVAGDLAREREGK